MFRLCIFHKYADIVEDAETHRIILLSMVTWWSKITLLHTFTVQTHFLYTQSSDC